MPKRGRPFEYQTDEDRPVTVSLRIPRDLYNRMETYRRMHRQSITELLLEGLQMRLDTPADPRDIIVSNEDTVIQELQDMIRASVQAEIGKLSSFMQPHFRPAVPTLPLEAPTEPVQPSHFRQASHIAARVPDVSHLVQAAMQAAPEQPEARTAEGTTIQPYDETRYMLGPLCVNQHDYQGTGQSLRRRGGKHECVECKNARSRAYKGRQRLVSGSA